MLFYVNFLPFRKSAVLSGRVEDGENLVDRFAPLRNLDHATSSNSQGNNGDALFQ